MIGTCSRLSLQLSRLALMSRATTTAFAKTGCMQCLQSLARSTSHQMLYTCRRSLNTSHHMQAGRLWRDSQGQSRSGFDYGPLVDLPDWSYADGRPAPEGTGQLRRQEEQKHIAERIDRLASEMIGAVQKKKDELKSEQRTQHEIEQRKLKTKGKSHGKTAKP